MDKYQIPRYLDDPFRVVFWTLDELVVFGIPFVLLFFTFNSPLIAMVVATIAVLGMRKLKGDRGPHFLLHLVYWYLPPISRFKVVPPSHIRFILG